MMFYLYNGIGVVFSWSFFPTVKTKAFNLLAFFSVEKGPKFANRKEKILGVHFLMLPKLSGLLKCVTDNVFQLIRVFVKC